MFTSTSDSVPANEGIKQSFWLCSYSKCAVFGQTSTRRLLRYRQASQSQVKLHKQQLPMQEGIKPFEIFAEKL